MDSVTSKVAQVIRDSEGRVLPGRLAQMVMQLVANELEPLMGKEADMIFWEDAVRWIRSQAEEMW